MGGISARWAVPVVAGVALLVAGCDSPPEAETKAADSAIAAAKSAEADTYAAPAYKAVTDLQRQAEGFMTEKKYKEAKVAYERAKGLADEAGKAAVAGKSAMKAEVEKGIAAAEAAWAGLEKQAAAVAKRMKPDVKKAWEEEAKAAQAALKSAKDAVANSPTEAKAQLATVLASIEKWSKDLAAAVMPKAAAAPKMPQVKTPAPAKKP
jgi:molecular chaperone DnaK (HSP70)